MRAVEDLVVGELRAAGQVRRVACAMCEGTGMAKVAFKTELYAIGVTDSDGDFRLPNFEQDADRIITAFCVVCWSASGNGEPRHKHNEVLAHCVNRAAMETTWRLGDAGKLFDFLVVQHDEVFRDLDDPALASTSDIDEEAIDRGYLPRGRAT